MSATRPRTVRRRRRLIAFASAVATIAIAAAAVWAQSLPPGSPPPYAGARPEVQTEGYLTATHSVFIAAPPDQVWEWSNDPDLSLDEIVTFDGDSPSVEATVALRGDWVPGERTGDRRRVEFSDGHFLAEEVLVDDRSSFRYVIWGFTSIQRFAVQHGVAEFRYAPEGEGTLLTWSYSLLPTTPLLAPVVDDFLDETMSPMMRTTLQGMRAGVEARSGAG